MSELRTDHVELDSSDILKAVFQPASHQACAALADLSIEQSQRAMQAVVQMFRVSSDEEIASAIRGTTAAKAADIRAMLSSAGLL